MFFSETIYFINKSGFNNNSDNNNHSPSTFTERFGLNSGFTIQNVEKKPQRVQDQKHVNVFWYKKQQTLKLNVYTDVLKSKRS